MRLARLINRVATAAREVFRPQRLLVVAKTAAAATAAWLIGHFLPGESADYAYYAPFGAILAMTPTLTASMKAALRMVASATIGLLLAWGLLLAGFGGVTAVVLAVGMGMLLAGIPALGDEWSFVPLAAVFLFVAGGSDRDGFSLGFGLQLALGAALGLVVNVLVPPRPGYVRAENALATLRDRVARHLESLAETLDHEDVSHSPGLEDVNREVENARVAVEGAARGRSGNARALRAKGRVDRTARDLDALQRAVRHLHDLADALASSPRDQAGPREGGVRRGDEGATRSPGESASPDGSEPSVPVWGRLSRAGSLVADVVRRPSDASGGAESRLDEALEALDDAAARADQAGSWDTQDREKAHAMTFALRQVIAELR